MTSQVETSIRVVETKDVEAVADTTDLAIIDARQFEDASIARVHLAHRVPPGLHGKWQPTTEVE